MQGMIPLSGFGGAPYSAIRKAAPRNLLDNSDFRNPVNQRGQTSYNASGYTIDRWRLWSAEHSVTVVDGVGVKVEGGNLVTYIAANTLEDDKKYTYAAKDSDGNLYICVGSTSQTANTEESSGFTAGTDTTTYAFTLRNGHTWVWAALYEGEYTAATLPEYHPKGYGAELAECQRYYQNLSTIDNAFDVVLNGFVSNTSTALAVSLPGMSKMRITPTVVFSGGIVVRGNNGYSSDATYGTPYMSPNVVPRLNTLVFYKSDNSAWAGIDNNTNISISLKLGSILSLSADL